MKNQMLRNASLLLLILCVSIAVNAQETKAITILHTNDVHSRIEPLAERLPDTIAAGNGGFIRVAAYVNQMRKDNKNVLVFDCGDFSQGTPYYNLFRGDVEINLMNAIGYNAGTIGNHEFDFGIDNMARIMAKANHPIVCANYDFTGTVLEDIVKPYVIIEIDGLKIGVFGLGVDPGGLIQGSNYPGMKYYPPYEKANEVAALLKEAGCDAVVCLSHIGMFQGPKKNYNDMELVKNTRNIDVVLGGHSHTLLQEPRVLQNLDGKDVPISQMGRSGIYVGRIDLKFE